MTRFLIPFLLLCLTTEAEREIFHREEHNE